jgi:single-stranded DNA-binding protein
VDERLIVNNQVNLIGIINKGFEFSHEMFGEGFYNFTIRVPRLSKNEDTIPITASERIIDINKDYSNELINITGQFRSYNRHVEGKNRLLLTVFARELFVVGEEEMAKNPNYIYLNGYLCKEPLYRTTPFGREITDILIAVNRAYNKSDYIPCICWGRNAKYAKSFEVGEKIQLWGRIQSREYQKKVSEDKYINKIAYEVSISKLEKDES